MADIAWTEFHDKEIQEFLKGIDKKTKKVQKEYAGLLSAIVYQDVMDHFSKQEGSSGPWKQWSKSYKDAIAGKIYFRNINGNVIPFDPKEQENPPKPPRKTGRILQDTGKLRNGFIPKKYRINSDGILWYNNAKTKSGFPYAAAHDEGGDKLPKRDFMWLSDGAMNIVAYQTLQYLLDEGV